MTLLISSDWHLLYVESTGESIIGVYEWLTFSCAQRGCVIIGCIKFISFALYVKSMSVTLPMY